MINELPRCPICNQPLSIQLARGRKSGKPFVMLICTMDGRHFRAFINHRPYVQNIIDTAESIQKTKGSEQQI